MNTIATVVKRHPLVAFFVLAFGLSWGNYLLSRAFPSIPFLFPYGPMLAALIVASVSRGRAGLKDLFSRWLRWRVELKWYMAALFVPVAIALVAVLGNLLLGASTSTTAQLGPWYSLLLLFPMAMLDAPLGEETGWRGYALPEFSERRSRLTNSLMLGVLIAAWHIPVALEAPSIAAYLIGSVASAVLANWVFYNARGSALLVVLYHTAQNTIGGWYLFRLFSGPAAVTMWWLWAALYVVAVLVVVLVSGPDLTREPTAKPRVQVAS